MNFGSLLSVLFSKTGTGNGGAVTGGLVGPIVGGLVGTISGNKTLGVLVGGVATAVVGGLVQAHAAQQPAQAPGGFFGKLVASWVRPIKAAL